MLIIKHLKLHIPSKTDNARLRSQLIKRLKVLIVAITNLLGQALQHLNKQIYKIFSNRFFINKVFIDKSDFF
jgi:hypothetical protein